MSETTWRTNSHHATERPIDAVRGTRDWLPHDFARFADLEALLLERFARSGYDPIRTPVLEFTELHERKSGAGIVSKLFELADAGQGGVCLRPELTAGIVRAYTAAPEPIATPWRVSHSGPVFRYETPRPDRLREFQQVGVERIGDSGPLADAEVIWLADWALSGAGVEGATIRLGHVGLILEMLQRSGLPAPLASSLIERLSEAAAEGDNIESIEESLGERSRWLQTAGPADVIPASVEQADDQGIDRLFRMLVPVVTGRRSGHEIIHRQRRKWDLGHRLNDALDRVRSQVHGLAGLKGTPAVVLDRLGHDFGTLAPDSVAALRALVDTLEHFGVNLDRVELDLGFGRGIGFYSQMIFELIAPTPSGPVEVCGGGRYDGLARVLGGARDDRGVGFAFGLERLRQVLDAQGSPATNRHSRGFLVLASGPDSHAEAIRLTTRLRAELARAILESERSFDEALVEAQRFGLAWIIAVKGPLENAEALVLHDVSSLTETERTLAELDQMAREEAEESRP